MAQVSVAPSPASVMSRRTPLTNLPNAVNSPYQLTASSTTTTNSGKRARPATTVARDASTQPPPSKRQHIDPSAQILRTPQRRVRNSVVDSKAIPKRTTAAGTRPRPTIAGPPAFADIGLATRRTQASTRSRTTTAAAAVPKPVEIQQTQDNLDTVRAWQKHYRNAFPQYVFFFENIPQEVMDKAQEHIKTLKASTEKFFSSKVTHVITTRAVDELVRGQVRSTNLNAKAPTNSDEKAKKGTAQGKPMLFDQASKGRGSNDILMKAWDYGMKIWALEKLQRVLNGLLDLPINHGSLGISVTRRGQSIQSFKEPTQGTLDLSHLLKNERLHGPTDRDPNATSKDLIHFKGPFVYVYDLFSQNRPTMVRDYPKAPRREDGTWPQFRSVSSGKCPFIEESVHQRREKDRGRERERLKAKEAKEAELLKAQGKVVEKVKEIVEIQDIAVNIPARRSASVESRASTNSKRPPPIPLYRRSISRQENTVAFTATNQQAPGRYTHEPAASGVQPSHITSAIRSHNVSSHQDQPGTRAGMSKEIYGLQRKVAGNVLLGNPRGPSLIARQLLEPAAPVIETRRRATENSMKAPQSAAVVKKPAKKPDPKPGYCENCRDKFDDFEDHTKSRKHRKFATDTKNWQELDELLDLLHRPLKKPRRP